METFVFEGTEVKKTGRTASKKLPIKNRELILIEITPVDTTFDWKKWVRPEDLYEVKTN
jgi:hypothetical protein